MFFNPGPELTRICVLYDLGSGRIVHPHEVVTPIGGREVDESEVETRTFRRATALGKDTSGLKALHVSAKDYDHSSVYKVDTASGTLVSIPKPERRKQ